MAGMNWDEMTAEERLIAEQAVLNFRVLNKSSTAAKDGTVLNVCGTLALRQGRELIRQTIQASLDLQAREVKKKSAPQRVCPCGLKRRHRGLKVSDTTIREMAQEHGAQANEWMRSEPVAVKEFREAAGNIEFTTDGTCVNTTAG